MAPIPVPKVPRNAYNPGRDANALLRAHVVELEKAAGRIPGYSATKRSLKEGEAATYVRLLTRKLHQKALFEGPAPALTVAPERVAVEPVAKPKPKSKPRAGRRAPRAKR